MIRLSIITITRNNSAGLIRTLDSSLRLLRREDVEVVVIDGASTDDSMSALQAWRARAPAARCVVASEPDNGIYDAMNKGLRIASGSHVVFMNSGDSFAPNFTFEPSAFDASAVYYGDARFESPMGGFLKHYRIRGVANFLNHNTFCHQALYYPRQLLLDLEGYDLSYHVSADFDLTLRCFLRAPFRPLHEVTSVCELGGFSDLRGWWSYKERLRSIRNNLGLRWWLPLAAYTPIFYVKHRIVRSLEGSRLLMWYRNLRTERVSL